MGKVRVCAFAVSLDGYGAGTQCSADLVHPLTGGSDPKEIVFGLSLDFVDYVFQERLAKSGDASNRSAEIVRYGIVESFQLADRDATHWWRSSPRVPLEVDG